MFGHPWSVVRIQHLAENLSLAETTYFANGRFWYVQ